MIDVRISQQLKTKCPKAALGCVEAQVETGATPAALEEALLACEERIKKLADPRAILETPAILATRAGYKALGKDPARYRGSAEALLRRLIAGKGLPRINSVVDVINVVSVESRLPIGLYDLARVEGAIEFRAGHAGETYKGIGKYDLNLEGLPLFADGKGPHGSATSDSERTMVTDQTKRVLAILVSFGGTSGLEPWNQRLSELLARTALRPRLKHESSPRRRCNWDRIQPMNTASSRQSLQDSEIDPSGLPSRYGDFLLGPAGLALSFLWGLAEATFFFVVPDVLLSLVAVFSLRRTWRHIALAVAGAISGGAFMFLWAQSDPDGAQAAVKKVPFVTEKMVVQVDAEYHRSGMVAVYMGPTTGTPYKIYAVEAPKFVSFAPFVLATIPARGWRFVLVSLFSAGCSAALRKYWKKSFRQLTLWHAAAWTAFYIFYWTRIAMS